MNDVLVFEFPLHRILSGLIPLAWQNEVKSYEDVIKARNEIDLRPEQNLNRLWTKDNLHLSDKESILALISVKSFRSIFPQPELLM